MGLEGSRAHAMEGPFGGRVGPWDRPGLRRGGPGRLTVPQEGGLCLGPPAAHAGGGREAACSLPSVSEEAQRASGGSPGVTGGGRWPAEGSPRPVGSPLPHAFGVSCRSVMQGARNARQKLRVNHAAK